MARFVRSRPAAGDAPRRVTRGSVGAVLHSARTVTTECGSASRVRVPRDPRDAVLERTKLEQKGLRIAPEASLPTRLSLRRDRGPNESVPGDPWYAVTVNHNGSANEWLLSRTRLARFSSGARGPAAQGGLEDGEPETGAAAISADRRLSGAARDRVLAVTGATRSPKRRGPGLRGPFAKSGI